MTRRNNLRGLAGIAVAAFLTSLTFGTAAHAQDLPQELPIVSFDSGGTATFENGVLKVNAFAIDLFSVEPDFYGFILAKDGTADSRGTFTIRAHMDAAGKLVVDPTDGLWIGGSIDLGALGGFVSGDNLLTGELRGLRFIDFPAPVDYDEVEFRFSTRASGCQRQHRENRRRACFIFHDGGSDQPHDRQERRGREAENQDFHVYRFVHRIVWRRGRGDRVCDADGGGAPARRCLRSPCRATSSLRPRARPAHS